MKPAAATFPLSGRRSVAVGTVRPSDYGEDLLPSLNPLALSPRPAPRTNTRGIRPGFRNNTNSRFCIHLLSPPHLLGCMHAVLRWISSLKDLHALPVMRGRSHLGPNPGTAETSFDRRTSLILRTHFNRVSARHPDGRWLRGVRRADSRYFGRIPHNADCQS